MAEAEQDSTAPRKFEWSISTEGVERLATPEEIENGIEYPDYDHYKEGRAA